MKRLGIGIALFFMALSALAQNAPIQGHSFLGGTAAKTQGANSTNFLNGIIPSATITVYLHGTTTRASIYSDNINTPLANPFTSNALSHLDPGGWIFWAAPGQVYDVVMSGGISPNTYLQPVTLIVQAGGGGGGSGVTFFSAGNLNPLFNTNVSNPGTTPNLSFSQQNADANTIFGNFTGVSGPPFFAKFICTGLLTCTYDNLTNIWNVDIPSTSALSVTATSPIRVNGGTGPVSSGTANIDCPTCGQTSLRMWPVGTDATHTFVPFGSCSTSQTGVTAYVQCTGSGGSAATYKGGLFGFGATAVQAYTGATLPSWLPAANVTDVKLIAYTSGGGYTASVSSSCGGSGSCATFTFPPSNQQITVPVSGVTGSTIGSLIASVTLTNGVFCNNCPSPFTLNGQVTVSGIGLLVGFSGVTAPSDTALNLLPPLNLYAPYNLLEINPYYPNYMFPVLVQDLPSNSGPNGIYPGNFEYFVSDNTQTTIGQPCTGSGTAGDGYAIVVFTQGNCTLLQPLGTGGGGSFSLTTTGTSGAATYSGGILNIPQYQGALTLTTTGTSGPATLVSNTLNIPQYSGGGSVGPGTVGFLPKFATTTTVGNSAIDDGATTAGVITSTEPIKVAASSLSTQLDMTYNAGHAPSGTAGSVSFAPDTSGNGTLSENGASYSRICTVANGLCSTGGTRLWSCQPGLGDGSNAISSGTYVQTTCMNTTGSTVTLSGISCFTDNSGTSTVNASGHTLGALLTGAITCTPSFAAGTQSANVLLTSGDYIQFTFVADGTSTQTTWVVKGTY